MKARKKQRVFQHIMEDDSYAIIKNLLPREWVIREFNRPDYGIDLVIELFDVIDTEIAETLGEFIFVQVKAIQSLELKREKIYPVQNVAKGQWLEDKSEYAEIDVVKFVIDTNTIYTIQETGSSVSVLLFVVDLDGKNVYFVCLNDYIEKIVQPKTPSYIEQDSITITIPQMNNLKNTELSLNALKFYGKRAKLLAAFSKFYYQKNELSYLFGYKDFPVYTYRDELENKKTTTFEDIRKQVMYFANQIVELDIWEYKPWMPLSASKQELSNLLLLLECSFDEKEFQETLVQIVVIIWHRLANLGRMYEDLCREWFLPKMISLLTSYPQMPEVIKAKKNS